MKYIQYKLYKNFPRDVPWAPPLFSLRIQFFTTKCFPSLKMRLYLYFTRFIFPPESSEAYDALISLVELVLFCNYGMLRYRYAFRCALVRFWPRISNSNAASMLLKVRLHF